MFKINPVNAVDSYKTSHHKMYAEGTEFVYSNFTPRSDRLFKANPKFYDGTIVFFGLQGALKDMHEIWQEEFFAKPKEEVCAEYARRLAPFCGGMEISVVHFEELHDVGYLPILVRGLREGSKVGMGVPVVTVINTLDHFYWITNYLETWLSNELWKPSTTATIAKTYRNILTHYAEVTGSPKEFVDWQGHDFSCRGMSGMVDAAKSGAGHLVSFLGTDTLSAVDYVEWAYEGEMTFVGGSVPASEHSVMTLDGTEGEFELFKRLITQVVPTGIVSLVSDGYDYWKVLTEYLPVLKGDILARKSDALGFAKVVIRPDSGDPVKIVSGYMLSEYVEVLQPDGSSKFFDRENGQELSLAEIRGSIQVLWDVFGGTTTETGHNLLDSHIGLIYGDSITLDRMEMILERLAAKGFASANMVFGVGSFTYQYLTRDTFGFAMKATWAQVAGEERVIFKAPKTDKGGKHSAKGLLVVAKDETGKLLLEQNAEVNPWSGDHGLLEVVYENGVFQRHQTFEEIRGLAK